VHLLSEFVGVLKVAGCGRIYQEKCRGKSKHRPELERIIEALRVDVVAQSLDRLWCSLKDLIGLLNDLNLKIFSLSALMKI